MKTPSVRDYVLCGMLAIALCGCRENLSSVVPHVVPSLPATSATGSYQSMDPPVAIAPSDFLVTYAGIIAQAQIKRTINNVEKYHRRAIIIQGNAFGMRHEPLLGVYGAELGSLNNLAGQPVQFCDHYYCWVLIRGIEMRVVDEVVINGAATAVPLTDSVDEDPSFVDLVPHLRNDQDIDGGELSASLKTEDLPPPPADGYFEMAGGSLSACPFVVEARFVHNGTPHDCRQFASLVFWWGHTANRARLQIKSKNGDWKTVKLKSDDLPLKVAIANLGTEHHTSRHFVLNEKIVANKLPTIDTTYCSVCQPSADHKCYACTVSLNDIAGCSNSQWP